MDVSNEAVDLSNLIVMLEKVMEATNITKKSICASCLDVRSLLKDWYLPNDRESLIPICTCFDTQVDDVIIIEEIARDIEDVVGNAQKLRAGVSSKTSKTSSRLQTRPTCKQTKTSILSSPQTKWDNLPQSSTLSQDSRQPYSRPILQSQSNIKPRAKSSQTGLKLENTFNSKPSYRPNSDLRKTTSTGNGINRPRRPSSGSASCSSSNRSNTCLQSTYQKDYTPSTSPRISNNASKVSLTAGLKKVSSNTSSQTEEPVSATISMAQLDDLLSRVSIGRPSSRQVGQHSPTDSSRSVPSMHSSKNHSERQLNDECLIHGKAIYLKSKVSETRVDFREAIDRLGVPSKLVKILKPYHSFLNKLQHQEDQTSKEKSVSNTFLERINRMNKTNWNEAMCEPSVSLFSEYAELFKESSALSKSSRPNNNVCKLRENMDTLEKTYRKCSSYDVSFHCANKPVQPHKVTLNEKRNVTDWAMSGVWNALSIKPNGYCAMEEALCIRYNNEQQLTSFQENMQQAQRLQYQNRTLEILRRDVLPHLSNLSPGEPAFVALFKTVAALCDLNNLTLPILVKIPQAGK